MDLKETLTNPWVIGGGAVIGLLILFAGRGGGGGGGDNASALYGYAANMTALSVDYGKEVLSANTMLAVSSQQTALAYLAGKDKHTLDMATVAAGVTQSQIAARTAITLDRLDNSTTRALARIDLTKDFNLAKLSMSLQLQMASMMSDLQKNLAGQQADVAKQQGLFDFVGGLLPGGIGNAIKQIAG